MYPNQNRINLTEYEKYRLPIYNRKSKDKIVYFYVLDPQSLIDGCPKLKRIRKKFAHIHSAKERDDAAMRFCNEIANKLRTGWNPLLSDCSNMAFASYDDVIDRYCRHLKKLVKDEVLKPKTYRDYLSRLEALCDYNQTSSRIHYIYEFKTPYIESFLEWIYIDRDNSPRTRNNYLTWISTFCTWLRSNGYISGNPCEDIRNLRAPDKQRKPLTKYDMKRLRNYLQEHNRPYLLACMMQYYTFVRPSELVNVHVGDISVMEQTLFVSGEVSKNRKDGVVTLPKKLMTLMIDLGVLSYPSEYYLFGQGFMPSATKSSDRIFRDEFARVRKTLDFPTSYQFYSLKDTGISDAIDSVGLTITKDQARHSSIQITNIYCRKEQLSAHPELKNFDGNF